jgi:uncharacterized membrane protein
MVATVIEASSDLALFLGRFHPVLVHLPIGFLVLLAALELLALTPQFRAANSNARLVLVLTLPAAIASAGCGWLLGRQAGYEGGLLEWHERGGIGVAFACAVLLALHTLGPKRAYQIGLILTCGLLLVTSHLGGSLTHGRDYLTRYAPGPVRAWLGGGAGGTGPVAAAPTLEGDASPGVFDALVQPILRQYCVSCHGPEKAKAGLRLDSLENLQRGNERGPVIRAGDSAGSPLVHFMTLPLEDDSHMPPAGKAQPSPDDLTLLRWWIDSGASPTAVARELKPSAEIERVLKTWRPGGEGDR